MNKILLFAFLYAFLTVPALCQGLKENSVNNILKDMYNSRKEAEAKKAMRLPPLKPAAWQKSEAFPTPRFNNLLEESKKEKQSFEDFIKANLPQQVMPDTLQNVFSELLYQSVETQRGYYLKKSFSQKSIVDTCNLYAYYTACAIADKKIPLNFGEYKVTDIYLIKVSPAQNPNTGQGTASVLGLPMLKTAEDTFNFIHEDGRKQNVWNFHSAPMFVVRDKTGRNYFVITDPFLYNKSVTFEEWIERFYRTTKVTSTRFSEDASLNNNRVYISGK
jgi:hypothetical protein